MAAIIQKIRAGNQFEYLWAIERAGVAIDLTTATDIELSYGVGKLCADYSTIPFTVVDTNKISSSHLYGITGTYNLKLEFKIDGEQSTIDIDAFKIVPRSEDASDSTRFAVTSDMAIGFKGDKGDKGEKLTFADLTPSDIAELQQPANDAIASIQAVEEAILLDEINRVNVEKSRVTAESDRVFAENSRQNNEDSRNDDENNRINAEVARQTNTGTAIQNAQTATTNANNAATLANTKAGLADTAANNANTKAGLANTAATNADNARLAIANELAGKQATLVSGTNIKTVNGKSLVGSGDVDTSLLAEYVYNSNVEIVIDSVDVPTSIFTRANHGLVNNDVIFPITNGDDFNQTGLSLTPFQMYPGGLLQKSYFVINSSVNTFQLSETTGGAPITMTVNTDMNLLGWHFEKITNTFSWLITGLQLPKRFRVEYDFRVNVVGTVIRLEQYYNSRWFAIGGTLYVYEFTIPAGTISTLWIYDYFFSGKNAKEVGTRHIWYADNTTKTIKSSTSTSVRQSNFNNYTNVGDRIGFTMPTVSPMINTIANKSTIRVYKL